MTETPKDCRECEHAKDCKSYYGGTQCRHWQEIILDAMRKAKTN